MIKFTLSTGIPREVSTVLKGFGCDVVDNVDIKFEGSTTSEKFIEFAKYAFKNGFKGFSFPHLNNNNQMLYVVNKNVRGMYIYPHSLYQPHANALFIRENQILSKDKFESHTDVCMREAIRDKAL